MVNFYSLRQVKLLLVILIVTSLLKQPGLLRAGTGCFVSAQNSSVNVRSGPGTGDDQIIIGVLEVGDSIEATGRDATGSWLQVVYVDHAGHQAEQAWVATSVVTEQGSECASLPTILETPSPVEFRRLMEAPILPMISDHVREIFRQGQALGNVPNVFTTLGDCNTDTAFFLHGFDMNLYDLGPYGDLQPTVDFFAGSFIHDSPTAQVGYSTSTMLDPLFASPQICQQGESSLECEYRRVRPSVAIMMFGLNDMCCLTEEQFSASARQIIDISLANGVIPVLTTFTWHHDRWWSQTLRFNAIILDLAEEYDIPVVNFWRAAQSLPDYGLVTGYTHLTDSGFPVTEPRIVFNGQEKTSGFALRNLLTLQVLDLLRREVLTTPEN